MTKEFNQQIRDDAKKKAKWIKNSNINYVDIISKNH